MFKDAIMKESAFFAVAVMAIGNDDGRIAAGLLSDKIGRRWTFMLIQTALMSVAILITKFTDGAKYVIVLVATLIGFNYGANLSLFPSLTKELWGLKSFGMNYGMLFTAWGVGGLVLPKVQQILFNASKDAAGKGNYASSFMLAGGLLIAGTALTFLIKPSQKAA
jgi:MFS family permease